MASVPEVPTNNAVWLLLEGSVSTATKTILIDAVAESLACQRITPVRESSERPIHTNDPILKCDQTERLLCWFLGTICFVVFAATARPSPCCEILGAANLLSRLLSLGNND
jgi:hypothetical protein